MSETYTNQITIDIRTKDWTMGYYYSCDVLAPKGCPFTIEWGDGKTDQRCSKGEWVSLIYEYPKSDYREELPIASVSIRKRKARLSASGKEVRKWIRKSWTRVNVLPCNT